MGRLVNKAEFAEIIGLSPRMVSNYIDEGMPASGTGKKGAALSIDTEAAIHWLIEREITKRIGSVDPDTGIIDIAEARRIKTLEEHRKLKIENDKEEDRLLPADDVRQGFSSALVELGALLDGAAGKMAGGDAVLRQKLLDEHRRIRSAFADRLSRFGIDQADEPSDQAATEAGSVEVG